LLWVVPAIHVGCVAAADTSSGIVLVNHGPRLAASNASYFHNFPRDTLPRTLPWLGLFCGKSGCELREAAVTAMSGTVASCDDREQYAETIHASGNPVAVMAGIQLPLGKVPTVLLATKEAAESAHYKRLRKLGQWQVQLKAGKDKQDKPLIVSWVRMRLPKSSDEYMYRYHFGDGETKQFVFSSNGGEADVGGAVTPFVLWDGDLDGDGKIDLLMEIPAGAADGDACESDYRLYLSSRASGREILHKVSQTAGRKPGCGC
jgi:hypothetical protein